MGVTVFIVVSLVLSLVTACTTPREIRSDPLIGEVFRTHDRQKVPYNELIELMAGADVVYLGEKHDNSWQHEFQREVIEKLIARGKKPILGLELFSYDQTGYLLQYTVRGKASSGHSQLSPEQQLRNQTDLGYRREQTWQAYAPILRLAREHGITVFGLDLPHPIRLRLQRVGMAELTALERRLVFSTGFEDDAYRDFMLEQLKRAHCGWGSNAYLSRLYETWIARNDAMAMAITDMLAEKHGRPVVVIVGRAHVAHNLGVYERVAHLNSGVTQINLGFREIMDEPHPLDYYVSDTKAGGIDFGPDHELLWFTHAVPTGDPCEHFRRRPRSAAASQTTR